MRDELSPLVLLLKYGLGALVDECGWGGGFTGQLLFLLLQEGGGLRWEGGGWGGVTTGQGAVQ